MNGNLDYLKQTFIREVTKEDPATAFAWLITIQKKKSRLSNGKRVFSSWSRYQPETAEREFLAAGFTPEWIAERRKERLD